MLKTGAYRLRIDAHKTEALKWAQDTPQAAQRSGRTTSDVLLGSADEGSLSRFFDIPNEGSQFSGAQDIPARSMAARIALEGKPKTLGDFINRYYYALGTLRRGRAALGKKPARGRREGAALQLRDRPGDARGRHGLRERGSGRQRPQGRRDVHQARLLARGHRQGAARQRG